MYAKFHHNILHSSRDGPFSLFQNLELGKASTDKTKKMSVRNPLAWILSIAMFTQKFIKIFHSVQEIEPFSLFQDLALGKASNDDKCHFASLGLELFNIKLSAKFYQNIPNGLRVKLHCFRIWTSAKPRPMKNDITQSLGLDLVSINVCATVHQNISLSLRDMVIFTFSEFGARQSLDR